MVIADIDLLVLLYHAALDAPDGDTADILVIVDAADEHLEGLVKVHARRGDIVKDRVEQGLEVGAGNVGGVARSALPAGAEEHRGIQLLIRRVEVDEQFEHLIYDLVYTLVGAVDLIDDDDDAVAELQRAAEHEARLRHRTFCGVDQQDNAVDHLEYTLHLAAEVGVTRGVNYVYLRVAIPHGGVLCHDGDAALTFEIVRVHDALHDLLILAVNAGLLEHFIDKSGLAVVNVCNNGDVSKLIHIYQCSLAASA